MRTGRPKVHIRAKWVTWRDETISQIEFYELDKKGKLVVRGIQPTHIRPLEKGLPVLRPALLEATHSTKERESQGAVSATSGGDDIFTGAGDTESFLDFGLGWADDSFFD
jgi:hypothetical protein